MSRKDALIQMQKPTYPSEVDENKDVIYFLKKMKWDKKRLEKYLNEPEIRHDFYPSERNIWNNYSKIYKYFKNTLKRIF